MHLNLNWWKRCLLLMVLFVIAGVTCRAESVLNIPRLSFESGAITGVAVANPTNTDAVVKFTLYGAGGIPVSSPGLRNPQELPVKAGQQISRLATEIFDGTPPAETIAWAQATSTVDRLTGFFTYLNQSVTFIDGADLAPVAGRIVFNTVRVGKGESSEVSLINPGSVSASVQIQLMQSGATPVTRAATIAAKGTLRFDVATLFNITETPANAYLTATSDSGIAGFEIVRPTDGDVLGLNARPGDEQLGELYFPQFAVLGGWNTELGLVNYSNRPVIAAIYVYKADGTLYSGPELQNNPVTRTLDARESLRESVAAIFGFSGPRVLDGWLRVESTAPALNGYLSYGSGKAIANVTSPLRGFTRALFSHIATSQGYFTGVAILNPGSMANRIRLLALRPDGRLLGSFQAVLRPGGRLSQLITLNQLIPEAADQNGGMIWVRSEQPLYLSQLFGTQELNTLANVPPQPAPESYQPDAAFLTPRLEPSLTSVALGASQTFSVLNASGNFAWKINGVEGGNATIGTITGSGVYRAPSTLPQPQVLTITAEQSGLIAGASVDLYQKDVLASNLGVVQSVAYLKGLKRLYTAELTTTSASQPTAQMGTTSIFDNTPGSSRTSIVTYAGEVVPKMVSFAATSGSEYLLLAGQTSGKLLRLNPQSRQSKEIITGLKEPSALVIDPATGNLLIAEADKISVVPRTLLEIPDGPNKGRKPIDRSTPRLATLFSTQGAAGLAVDPCSGDVYFSDPIRGELRAFDRSSGAFRIQATGLRNPGQLLGLVRSGVSCPAALQVLVVERGANQVTRVVPSDNSVTAWLPAQGVVDLAFLPAESRLTRGEGVLVAEAAGVAAQIALVTVPDLYRDEIRNPPERGQCFGSIVFADPELDAAVAAALRRAPGSLVDCSAAATVVTLDAHRRGIRSLAGIEALKGLRSVDLGENQITDLGPLSALPALQRVQAAENQLDDVTPLASLPGLTYLDLRENLIQKITPLAGLVLLEHLDLHENRITDPRPVAGMTRLKFLALSANTIRSVADLVNLRQLQELHLESSGLNDVSPLAGLTKLTLLHLSNNEIRDIRSLSQMTQMVELVITGNEITDLSALSAMTALRSLDISVNQVSNIGPLSDLRSLIALGMAVNPINDLTPVANLSALMELHVERARVTDIRPLAGLRNLVTLHLDDNTITDFSPLANLPGLLDLGLNRTAIKDLTFLSAFKNLKSLRLEENGLSDFGRLSDLTSLTELNVAVNAISSLQFLSNLKNLVELSLQKNAIIDLAPLTGLDKLAYLALADNQISSIAPLVANAGLGTGDRIFLEGNTLNSTACPDLKILIGRGAIVRFSPQKNNAALVCP